MQKYEFGGRMGCCAFTEIIEAHSYEEAVMLAQHWCEIHDAVYEYCISA